MCGICGVTGRRDDGAIQVMNRAMRHRGPDDEGIYFDGEAQVGLGVRRLSIIDVAGGHQPLSNEDGSIWAILNGEIYNHPRLRDQLKTRGHSFSSNTDTEVIVHLYEEYGDAFVHALEGMFAFAVWDGRGRRLILGRDRFGEKPLFYSESAGALYFASELTALSAAGIGCDVSEEAVDAFYLLGYVPGPSTIIKGIYQLPPGHLLIWSWVSRSVKRHCYWAPVPYAPTSPADWRQLVDEAEQLLGESVRSRMISDVPLGVFLSGGIDSTLVAAFAAKNSPARIKTFTVGYDLGHVSELEPARRSATALGSEHHEYVLTGADVSQRVPAVLAALDQPLADQALIASHALAEQARQHITVAVGGEGADELFGGYPRYRWLSRSVILHRAVPRQALAVGKGLLDRLPIGGKAIRVRTLMETGATLAKHMSWVTGGRGALREQAYGRLLSKRRDGARELILPGHDLDGDVGDLMRLDQQVWLPDDVLMKADRSSMLVSLEVRTPYLDRRLAEFAYAIPAAIHCSGPGKQLLRAVLRKILPLAAATRPKTAFRVPMADWLRGPLASLMSAQLQSGQIYTEGWFDRDAVTVLYMQHMAGTHDWNEALWPLLTLGLWLDHYRGGRAA